MRLKEITSCLEAFAPLALQESYDNAGLICGDGEMEVTGVLLCLDSTEAVLDEAIKKKCNLVIAHHPIVFSGIKKLTGKNYVERVLIKAIRNHIAIYAAHTNLDNVRQGVNGLISEKLGLINTAILAPKHHLLRKLITFCPVESASLVREALFAAGAGHIGHYDECSFNSEGTGTFRGSDTTNPYVGKRGEQHHEKELKIETVFPSYLQSGLIKALLKAHPYEEVAYDIVPLENKHYQMGAGMIGELSKPENELDFLKRVKSIFNSGVIRHTPLLGKKVKKIAVCGGAGSFLLPDAIAAGADMFITADYKYHQFFDADNKIVIADVGHYESEQYTPEIFHRTLKVHFPALKMYFSKVTTNPVKYF